MNLRELRRLDRDDLLSLLGLERKSSTDWILPTVGALGVGLVVGAGLGLFFAPKTGEALRGELAQRFQRPADSLVAAAVKGVTGLGTRTV